jgi:hypothetical protein
MTPNEKIIVDIMTSELDLTANTGIAELLSAARKILSALNLSNDTEPQQQSSLD